VTTLAPAARLLDALHARGIRYCHWKSNEHLLAGLAGDTDLDMLFDRQQYADVTVVLAECGFRRFDGAPRARYPASEDHSAWDCETGRLVHCHTHFQLVAGEPHLKGYRLPWEAQCLATRRWDETAGAYVADPNLELLMLLVRYATKLRTRDRLLAVAGRRYPSRSFEREYLWLLDRINEAYAVDLCRSLLGNGAVAAYRDLLAPPVTPARLLRFRRDAGEALARFRSHGVIAGRLLRWGRELFWLAGGVNRRYLGLRSTRPLRRTSPSGGLLIAVVGCDGSGKSTLTQALASTLGRKLDVCRVYFGSGDGATSLLRWPLRLARGAAVRAGLLRAHGARSAERSAERGGNGERSNGRRARGMVLGAGRIVWALVLSFEKRERLARAWRARDRGMIVIADRYPQVQLAGFNDGPLLDDLSRSRNGLLRRLARWEAAPYRRADDQPPDLLVRLDVSVDVAERRKPETGRSEIERRVTAVRSLRYRAGAAVVDVDADRPAAEVFRQVRTAIWHNL